jgi:hypothetical protein
MSKKFKYDELVDPDDLVYDIKGLKREFKNPERSGYGNRKPKRKDRDRDRYRKDL